MVTFFDKAIAAGLVIGAILLFNYYNIEIGNDLMTALIQILLGVFIVYQVPNKPQRRRRRRA